MILCEYVILPEPTKKQDQNELTRNKRCQAWRMKIQLVQSTTSSGFETKWKLGSSKGNLAEVGLYMVTHGYTWSNQNETYMGGSLTLLGNRTSIVSLELHNQNTTMNMNDMCMMIFIDAVLHCGKLHVTTPLQHHNNYPTEASFWWALSEVRGTSCLCVAPRNECPVGPSFALTWGRN